jgi:hypothetical protein
MTKQVTRERMLWRDGVVTVLEKGMRRSTIRDKSGYVVENVLNKELEELRDDDPEKFFTITED